jgi:SAM-dependent methyltransferase
MTTYPDTALWTARARLEEWLSSHPGQILLETEREQLGQVLPRLFGYHILQIGALGSHHLLGSSCVSHRIVLDIDLQGVSGAANRLMGRPEALPLAANSTDVVVLPHILEFTLDPHQVLREVDRILIGEGHVVVLGFNPWSLWGMWRAALAWRREAPWCGQFLGRGQIKDWLRLLGFDIVMSRCFFFRPPLPSPWIMSRLTCLEQLGGYCWPYWGGAYIVVGKKRVVIFPSLRLGWRESQLVAGGLAKPAS